MIYSVTKSFTVAPVLISISALKRIGPDTREEEGMVGRFLAIPTGCRFQVCPAGTTTYWSRGRSKVGPRPPPGDHTTPRRATQVSPLTQEAHPRRMGGPHLWRGILRAIHHRRDTKCTEDGTTWVRGPMDTTQVSNTQTVSGEMHNKIYFKRKLYL